MRDLDIQVTIYNRHQNRKYSSYRGTVGHLAPNRLHQNFCATKPYQVCHTDVSQVHLDNAPVESFFHILKTELLDGLPLFEDITAFQMMVQGKWSLK